MGELNRTLIGKTYPAKTYPVTGEATAKYALATNDQNPAYLDEARAGGIIAPPLFAVAPAFEFLVGALTDPELQLPLDRVLHGEQDMYFTSPIRPGDVLITEGRVAGMEERSTGETLDIEVLSKTESGEERLKQILTVFVRDPNRKGAVAGAAPADRGAPAAESVMKVTEDQSFRYADASGDHNPPHVDDDFAKAIGYKGVFLQGLCTMAFTSQAAIQELAGGDPARLKRLKVRFSKVVYPGDVLTTSFWSIGDGAYEFETRNQDGVLVIKEGIAEIA